MFETSQLLQQLLETKSWSTKAGQQKADQLGLHECISFSNFFQFLQGPVMNT